MGNSATKSAYAAIQAAIVIVSCASAAPIEFASPDIDRNQWTLAPEAFDLQPLSSEDARSIFAQQFDDLRPRVGDGPYKDGLALIESGRFAPALAAIDKAILADARPLALGYELRGVALAYLGKPADSLIAFAEAARLDPKAAGPRLKSGDIHFAAGDRAKAIAAYEAALTADPKSRRAKSRIGVALEGGGEPQRAIPFLEASVQVLKRGEIQPEHNALARAYLLTGEPVKALAVYKSASANAKTDRLATQIAAAAYLATGTPAEAVTAIEEYGSAKDDAFLQYLLGRAQAALGDYPKSVTAFRAARLKAPNSPLIIRDLATALAASGNLSEAETLIRGLIGGASASPGDYAALGELLLGRNKVEDAAQTYATMVSKFPGVALSYEKSGGLAAARGDYKGAIETYKKGLDAGAAKKELLRPLAVAQLRLGDRKGAIATAAALTGDQPKSAAAFAFAGSVYEQAEDWTRAEAAYRQSLALDPYNVAALNNLGSVLGRRGRYADALPYAKRAYEAEPGNPVIAGAYAWAEFKTGDAAKARAILEPLAASHPDDRRLSYRLGAVLETLGEREAAAAAMRKALSPGGRPLADADRIEASARLAELSGG